jgi:hypothetical protein
MATSAEPSVHERISSAHHHVLAALRRLAMAENALGAAEVLNELCSLLPGHFAAEEEPGGFFDAVVAQAPQHEARVAELRRQHGVLMIEVERVAALVRSTRGGLTPELRDAVAAVVARLREHEGGEQALLQGSVAADIGTAD